LISGTGVDSAGLLRVLGVLLVLGFAMVAFGRRRNPRNLQFGA
jgi:LPXTG-motif cell wall-anchored protein